MTNVVNKHDLVGISNIPNLTLNDYCDVSKCYCNALIRVALISGADLLFCGHHYDKLELSVGRVAIGIRDSR